MGKRGIGRGALEIGLEHPVPEEHEDRVWDVADRLDELFDPAVAREAAVVEDDRRVGREAEARVEPALGRLGRVEAVRAVQDDERERDGPALRHDLRVRQVDGDDAVRATRPSALGAPEDGAERTRQAGEVRRVDVDVPRVVDDPGPLPSRDAERDRDPHVRHPVDEVDGRGHRASRPSLRADGEPDRDEPPRTGDDAPCARRGPTSARDDRHLVDAGCVGRRGGRRGVPRGGRRGRRAAARPSPRDGLACPPGERQPIDRGDRGTDDPVAGRVDLVARKPGSPPCQDRDRVAARGERARDPVRPRVVLGGRRDDDRDPLGCRSAGAAHGAVARSA